MNDPGIQVLVLIIAAILAIAAFVAQMQLFQIASTLKRISSQLQAIRPEAALPAQTETLSSTKIQPRTLLFVGLGVVVLVIIVAISVMK